MATRFYCPSTGTPAISPTFGAGWGTTTNADRMTMVTARISSAMTQKDGAGTAATDNQLLRQYISSQSLAAQTLSGTVRGQVRAMSTTNGNGTIAIRVAKCAGDGTGVTELLAVTASTGLGQPPGTTTTMTNRAFEVGDVDDFLLDLTSTAVSAGDMLIVEIGYEDRTTNTARFISMSLGDDSATDLAEDETTTTANNPWVEFSMDISFGAGETVTIDKWLSRMEKREGGPKYYVVPSGMTPPDRND